MHRITPHQPPSLAIIGTPQNTRVLEGEMPHPSTGLPMRMYDARSFDRVARFNIRSTISNFWAPMAACSRSFVPR